MRLPVPLVGVDPANPLQGGFGYLDATDGGATYHPGVDLNKPGGPQMDCGALVVVPFPGTVQYVGYHVAASGRGFGHHLWIEHDDGAWGHFCHLQEPPPLQTGQRVGIWDTLGQAGRTAGWAACHLHWEIRYQRPPTWDFWPSGLPYGVVAAAYTDPLEWLAAKESELTKIEQLEEQLRAAGARISELEETVAQRDQVNTGIQEQLDYCQALKTEVEDRLTRELGACQAEGNRLREDLAALAEESDRLRRRVAVLEATPPGREVTAVQTTLTYSDGTSATFEIVR